MFRNAVIALCCVALPFIAFSQDTVEEAVSAEEASREALLQEAENFVRQGKDLVRQEKYYEAKDRFKQARAKFSELAGEYVDLQIRKLDDYEAHITRRMVKQIEGNARQAYAEKMYDKAIVLAREAMQVNGISDIQKNKLQAFVDDCDRRIRAETFVEEYSIEVVDPEKPAREYDIDVSVSQAKKLLANEQYIRARDALEKVLVRDPYNIEAMKALRRIYRELNRRGELRREAEMIERMAEVKWKWSEAVLPLPAVKPDQGASRATTGGQTGLYNKLNRLIIDRIDLEEATINAVIKHLVDISKRLDTIDKTGVSIILNMKEENVQNIPAITMSFDEIPMIEVIRYICQGCDLRYRVEEHAVIIGTDSIDPMETRFFTVRAALIQTIAPQAEREEDAFGDDDFFDVTDTLSRDTDTGEGRRRVTSEALQAYFIERGVPFPEDSTIAYDRRAGKLIVKNNHENLRRLESLLRELDVETPLVLIESKFVEITQTDLEDLGFEWLFNKDQGDGDSWWVIPQNDSTMRPLGTNASGMFSPVSGTNDRLINNALLFPGMGQNNSRHLSMYLHAIDQHDRSEVLSAPKVIATSGQTAIIRMVREEYYPESWTEPELVVGDGVVQYTPSYPELGEATDVGIRFEVTPTVSPNNYTITLQLSPQVVGRSGWTDYSYTIDLGPITGQVTALLIMPELSRRDVSTTVRVYDGETLVLGGMLRDSVSSVDDRIPILGDLPLVGRLARTTNEQSVKRNLLIFVTARLVNPDGLPVRVWDETKGLPDFRRL